MTVEARAFDIALEVARTMPGALSPPERERAFDDVFKLVYRAARICGLSESKSLRLAEEARAACCWRYCYVRDQ